MKKPKIFRRRFIPDETVDISSDELLYRDETILVTKWKPIRPRTDFCGGISYAFLKEGYKLSKFFKSPDQLAYWYCDIIDVKYEQESDTYIFEDLLLDVKVLPDGKLMVLDADELAEALEKGVVDKEQACSALVKMDKVLKMIYEGKFPPEVCNNWQ